MVHSPRWASPTGHALQHDWGWHRDYSDDSIAAEIMQNPSDTTKLSLIYACRQEEYILMRKTLEAGARKFSGRFKVRFVLTDKWPLFWFHSTGHDNAKILKGHLQAPGPNVYNLMCGPPAMLEIVLLLGHDPQSIFDFTTQRSMCWLCGYVLVFISLHNLL